MAAAPVYAATPRCGVGQLTVANTNRDGTGTIVTVFTAGSGGSRIDTIVATFRVTNTTGSIVYYLFDGTTYYNLPESQVTPATTVSTTQPGLSLVYAIPGGFLILPSGWSLRASATKAESVTVVAIGGDF